MELTTPKGNVLQVNRWQGLPYITADQIDLLFEDLPEADVKGRDGLTAGQPVSAAAVQLSLNLRASMVLATDHLTHSSSVALDDSNPKGQSRLCGTRDPVGAERQAICTLATTDSKKGEIDGD